MTAQATRPATATRPTARRRSVRFRRFDVPAAIVITPVAPTQPDCDSQGTEMEGNHLWICTLVHCTNGTELSVQLWTQTDRFADVMGAIDAWRDHHKLKAYRYFEALEQ